MNRTDKIKRNVERNKKLLMLLVCLFNLLMLFFAAYVAKISKFFAWSIVVLWVALWVCVIALNYKIKKDEKALKNLEKE